MRQGQSRAEFVDCAVHGTGSGAELFVVEGESAAGAVAAVRAARFQAVLPLQGKPLNALRSSPDKVRSHALYAQFARALGMVDATALEHTSIEALGALRFERVVLLMDPDADGIHIGALMLLYLHRFAPALVQAERIAMTRAPMFLLEPATPNAAGAEYAFNPHQCERLRRSMHERDGHIPSVRLVRGLASLAPDLLSRLCVDPTTRTLSVLGAADVAAAIEVFGSPA
jgi:DNA gyrase subunit B